MTAFEQLFWRKGIWWTQSSEYITRVQSTNLRLIMLVSRHPFFRSVSITRNSKMDAMFENNSPLFPFSTFLARSRSRRTINPSVCKANPLSGQLDGGIPLLCIGKLQCIIWWFFPGYLIRWADVEYKNNLLYAVVERQDVFPLICKAIWHPCGVPVLLTSFAWQLCSSLIRRPL